MADIPQSNALAEASPMSLSDMLGQDPEDYTPATRAKIVQALRDYRVRHEAAMKESGTNRVKGPKVQQTLITNKSAGDLGF